MDAVVQHGGLAPVGPLQELVLEDLQRRLPLAVGQVGDEPGADTAALINRCRSELDGALWLDSLDRAAPGHGKPYTWVDVFCHLPSAGETERVRTWLLDQPDVQEVECYFPRAWHVVTDWFDERIEARLEKAGAATD